MRPIFFSPEAFSSSSKLSTVFPAIIFQHYFWLIFVCDWSSDSGQPTVLLTASCFARHPNHLVHLSRCFSLPKDYACLSWISLSLFPTSDNISFLAKFCPNFFCLLLWPAIILVPNAYIRWLLSHLKTCYVWSRITCKFACAKSGMECLKSELFWEILYMCL